jgi:hypothetical protein
MTEQQSTPGTTSQISGIRSHTNFQAIDATFFNLTDTEGRATAGLLLLLDRMNRPVRAELHFYEEIDGFIRDNTVRQAQSILQDRYYSREPVALRVMYVFQDRKSYDVTLPQPDATAPTQNAKNINWKMIAGIVAAIVAVVAIGWAISRTVGSSSDAQVADEVPAAGGVEAVEEVAAETGSEAETELGSEADPESTLIQSVDLPESRNARNDLSVGMRAAILPGLQSFIRTEPDAAVGENVGIFEDGDAGLLIDGPITRPGESDTIVWWYIISDSGDEGWVPANTSQFTLLEPEE